VTVDPVFCPLLCFSNRRLGHTLRKLVHIGVGCWIDWWIDTGVDDSEPHICLDIVSLQASIAIHVHQLGYCLPDSSNPNACDCRNVVSRLPVPRGCHLVAFGNSVPLPVHLAQAELCVWQSLSRRLGNALLFYMNGYNSDNPDLALVAFTTCLEGLFSTVEQEISFRLALRLSHFLGESKGDKRSKFEQCREVYKVRSKVVHGAPVLKSSEAAAIYLVESIVPEAEKLARTALRKIFELHLETLFDQPNKVEALFEELLFEDSLESALAMITA